ncbi:MAG TPA: AAA family ATPase [Acidimicrobiales bacterium]|nr:AAA family ATPase [Acidimicrobiales bacterium]
MAQEREVAEEQRYLDRAHTALDAMREEARSMLGDVLDIGRGGTFQSRTERDIVVNTALSRLQQLDIGDQALLFGRIDTAANSERAPGESFHIGRVAVSDEDLEPLVVDWRAPIAEPFYRATGIEPLGLARRRHLQVRHREVLGLEDEYFTQADGTGPDRAQVERATQDGLVENGLALGGPGALLAALGQARTGQMGDIVATIQREQDEIIRAPLPGLLMVQGGPGTGKTAVALHRAAYLLYTHRFPLERQGVLVVGPNPLFLRYIEQVLPSLGEAGVTLSTVAGLVPEIQVRASEPDDVSELKGDARMARLVARAVRTRQRPLPRDVQLPFGVAVLTLSVSMTEEVVGRAKRRPGPHNQRHRFVERELAAALAAQYRRRVYGTIEVEEGDDLEDQIRRTAEFRAALRRIWPRLAPHELLHDLLGAPPLLRAAGAGLLTDAELARLHRTRSSSLDEVAWTVADAALVDEARTVLGPARAARRPAPATTSVRELFDPTPIGEAGADDELTRSYGHIVVDEVQDLSAMQLRMIARRSISGSMTVVGDMGQSTASGAAGSWDQVVTHLAPRKPPSTVELTVSYRTPKEVLDVAAGVLAVAEPSQRPPRPVRTTGVAPDLRVVTAESLFDEVVAASRRELLAVDPGRVAVLVPASDLAGVLAALHAASLHAVDPRASTGEGLAASLVVLPADDANGLEFDSVVVVEPSKIAERGGEGRAPTRRGLRSLYVAMTRPTRRLTVLGTSPLPTSDASSAPAQMWHAEAAIN